MATESSFDVVSDFDQQELVNAIDQTQRELTTRYDLKDSGSELDLKEGKFIVVVSSDEYKLNSIVEILATKVSKRGLSPSILDPGKVEESLGGKVKQQINLKRGISQELAKKIVAHIKETKLKVQPSIQGEQVRVTGKNKDDLQEVITLLRENSERWNIPLQFTNYR